MERRTGFEPATSRVADEVTAIFTTGRVEGWRGTRDAVLLCRASELRHFSRRGLNPRPPSACAAGALTEVTDIFTTASRDASRRPGIVGTLGNSDIGVSDVNTGVLAERLRCGAWQPLVRAPPQCVSHRRESNPLFQGTKYPVSSPPASVEPRVACARQTKNCLRRLPRRTHADSERVRSAIGVRLIASFPPAGPARSGTRLSSASPGIRVSRSGSWPGKFERAARRAIKNPPERLAREGP